MERFVEGLDRRQSSMFPERPEDWIGDDNPVRVIDVFADRGTFNSPEILACDEAGIPVHPSQAAALGQQGRGPVWEAGLSQCGRDDVYLCPVGERLVYHYTNEEKGLTVPSTDQCPIILVPVSDFVAGDELGFRHPRILAATPRVHFCNKAQNSGFHSSRNARLRLAVIGLKM